MLSIDEKKALLKAIEDIKEKSVTAFECFDSKDLTKGEDVLEMVCSMVDFAIAIRNLEELIERY